MFVEEPFAGVAGRFVSMPPRNVIPKPVQKPHPPLWVACSRRETIRLAAAKGIGALSFSFVEPEEAKAWVDEYYDILASERCVPGGFAVNPNVAVTIPMMVHPDEATAIERGIDGAHFFGYSLAHYYVFGEHRPGRTSIWEEFLARRDDVGFARDIITAEQAPLGIKVLQQGLGSLRGAIGTPDQVRDLVRRYEAAGVDQIIFVLQAGNNRHEHICEALELFGRDVLPEFKARAGDVEAAKRERLAPAVAAALARRAPAREADPGYAIAPLAGGPPADADGGVAARTRGLGERLQDRGEAAFGAFVHRVSDARLERTIGTDAGLRVLFGAMAQRYVPEKGAGFTGAVQYDLRPAAGPAKVWRVEVDGRRATARPGPAADPAVTIGMALADFIRLAGQDLDPGRALLDGRMEVGGDLALVARLGEMFGQPAAY
jgi:hypothetical protein